MENANIQEAIKLMEQIKMAGGKTFLCALNYIPIDVLEAMGDMIAKVIKCKKEILINGLPIN